MYLYMVGNVQNILIDHFLNLYPKGFCHKGKSIILTHTR